jgi:hypothetical protein
MAQREIRDIWTAPKSERNGGKAPSAISFTRRERRLASRTSCYPSLFHGDLWRPYDWFVNLSSARASQLSNLFRLFGRFRDRGIQVLDPKKSEDKANVRFAGSPADSSLIVPRFPSMLDNTVAGGITEHDSPLGQSIGLGQT